MAFFAEIDAAFPREPIPSAETLFISDNEDALESFRNRSWQELAPETVDYHASSLAALSPQGFAYYLPAFIVASLHYQDLGVADAVIDCLCPPKNDPTRASFAKRWESLSPQQKRVAIQFLRHFEQRNPVAIQGAIQSLEATIAGKQFAQPASWRQCATLRLALR